MVNPPVLSLSVWSLTRSVVCSVTTVRTTPFETFIWRKDNYLLLLYILHLCSFCNIPSHIPTRIACLQICLSPAWDVLWATVSLITSWPSCVPRKGWMTTRFRPLLMLNCCCMGDPVAYAIACACLSQALEKLPAAFISLFLSFAPRTFIHPPHLIS